MKKSYEEDIIADIRRDFASRAEARRPFETQWRLNINFYMGNQYCTAQASGDITDVERDYYWQACGDAASQAQYRAPHAHRPSVFIRRR